MASVMKKIKRKKSNLRDFQITASVAALTIECQKDAWHPHKLVILWGKENTSYQTKPVPWQAGVVNPSRGIHVWPEPNPVTVTSTLCKNTRREGTYKDHPWEIIVKNETKTGRRHVIATGCIDVADYISKETKTFDITVTLKPANKSVLSASIEFSFTSVMLEDGIPYRNKEDLIREIVVEAVKSAKHPKGTVKAKATTRSDADDATTLSSSNDETASSQNGPAEEESAMKVNTSQAGAVNSRGAKKVRRKAPPPPRPPPPTRRKTLASVTSPEKNCDIKDVTKSSAQGLSDEKVSYNANSQSLSARRKGRKKKKAKYPKELNPFGASSSSEEEPSLLLDGVSSTTQVLVNDEITSKVPETVDDEEKVSHSEVPSPSGRRKKCRGIKKSSKYPKALNPFGGSSDEEGAAMSSKETETKGDDDEEKMSCTEIPSPSGHRRKRRGLKKAKKYPKTLNPFGGSSDEETAAQSSEEPEKKAGFTPAKVTDQGDGKQGSSSQRGFSHEKVLLKKAKRYNPESTGETALCDMSLTAVTDGSSGSDESPLSSNTVLPPYIPGQKSGAHPAPKDVIEREECPVNGDSLQATMEDAGDELPPSSKEVPLPYIPGQESGAQPAPKDIADHEERPANDDLPQVMMEDAGNGGAVGGSAASGGTSSDQREDPATNSLENSHGTAPDHEETEDTDSAATEREKQRLPCFYKKLLQTGPHNPDKVPGGQKKAPPKPPRPSLLRKRCLGASQSKVFQHSSELSSYVAEEVKILQEEITSLDKVTVRLEMEMRQAMDIKDRKEELDGLVEDWLVLVDHMEELNKRKRDLQILDKQDDLDACCNILKTELKLLFNLEDWRKSEHNKLQEARLLELLVSFERKRRENC